MPMPSIHGHSLLQNFLPDVYLFLYPSIFKLLQAELTPLQGTVALRTRSRGTSKYRVYTHLTTGGSWIRPHMIKQAIAVTSTHIKLTYVRNVQEKTNMVINISMSIVPIQFWSASPTLLINYIGG